MSIEIKQVTHIYNAGTTYEHRALDNVSITIEQGKFVGLIGHTGSGKSTLIQHLNGLIKPMQGEILLNGENIWKDKETIRKVRQKVGLVFQYPEHQLFETTIYRDVAFGPGNMGLTEEEVKARVKEALEVVGLSEQDFEKSPFELSGGQKRRVAIAGVLAMKPEVLVLDEPTAGLDPKGRDEILLEIKNFHRTLGITVVLVSHSMEDVAKLADEIIVMHKGEVAMQAAPEKVFAQVEQLEAIGLAAPQASYLLLALQKKGIVLPNAFTVEDAASILYGYLS